MVDPLPNYLQLVTGLSKATRARARSAARSVLSQVGLDEVADDATDRITKLTEEIQAAGKANREILENLITTEVERAAGRLGFARKTDLEAVRAEVAVLRTMIQLQTPDSAPTTRAPATTAEKTATKKTATRKAPSRKAVAKKAPSKKAPATKAAATKAPATKAPARKAAATTTAEPETPA